MNGWLRVACVGLFCFAALPVLAQTREDKVRNDRKKLEAEGFWIYNDLDQGFAEAKRTGLPMLVVLRCLPCVECVKLDDELIEKHPRVRALLEKFVRVRLVSTNGLDLSLFQFDTDQSFAVFFLNADRTIYGRFGTRSARTEWVGDVSVDGLAKAMEGALDLHTRFPAVKATLAAKTGPAPEFPTPEKYPQHAGKYGPKLNYEGNVVQSCIHCHQVGEARRAHQFQQHGRLSETLLFSYPHPKSVGLVLDPEERATVLSVTPGTPAAAAGFRAGDAIESLAGQPLLSMADVQWVLHGSAPEGAKLAAVVRRGGETKTLELALADGWRRRDDLSWRASTWMLRRRALGGLFLKPVPDEERKGLGLAAEGMALRIEHVGQFAPHDVAKRAGFQKGDILISFDGQTNLARETDLITWSLDHCPAGKKVTAHLRREGKPLTLTLPIPQ